MVDTYTYTARHVDDPEKVITFTIKGEYLEINLTGVFEDLGSVFSEEDRKEAIKERVQSQATPTALKVMEEISGPVHIRDVSAEVSGETGERLQIKVWKRLGGLRAAPLNLSFGAVDNPEAAQAFVAELTSRQEEARHVGKFFGPLDYWLGWIGLAVLVLVLWRWPRRS